jgi:CHAD domain-containing protein
MAYRLKKAESVSDGLRRIAREQIDKAVAELTDADLDRHEAVHQFRKRGKKIRGLIRLFRPALGDTYGQENGWYRDAARKLSRVRDAEALLESLQSLRRRFPDQFDAPSFHDVQQRLELRRQRIADNWLDLNETIDELASQLVLARQRINGWRLDDESFDAVGGGLKQTYRRGCHALREVLKDPSDAQRHEWRKRTKYHWYHMRLLAGMWKPVIRARVDELKRLADLLGDDHDLAVFHTTVAGDPNRFGSPESIELLLGLILSRRKELQQQSDRLGRRVFAERPKKLVRRFEVYWSAWRTA